MNGSVDHSAQITLRALVTARWVLLGLLAVASLAVLAGPDLVAPLLSWFPQPLSGRSVIPVGLGWAFVNLVTEHIVLGRGHATLHLAGIHLLIDATVLTILLGLSGGATNPFTTVYFVPITLATQVSPRWTWALAGYCLAGFASLFVMHPLPQAPQGHEAHFAGHLRGMWVAFGVSGGLITYFVHRIALSLARQRQELSRLRDQATQDRHLTALGTLAAGAAHELGTPLGSIQLLIGELPHVPPSEQESTLGTIKREIVRCKRIVHRMASPELSAQTLDTEGRSPPWPLAALGDQARQIVAGTPITLVVHGPHPPDTQIRWPKETLEQIMRELVANAIDACRRIDPPGQIRVELLAHRHHTVVEVRDTGLGIPAADSDKIFDPFYSTKDEGKGMGLGLYLARAQLRQIGGTLELESTPAHGTILRMTLPSAPLRP